MVGSFGKRAVFKMVGSFGKRAVYNVLGSFGKRAVSVRWQGPLESVQCITVYGPLETYAMYKEAGSFRKV